MPHVHRARRVWWCTWVVYTPSVSSGYLYHTFIHHKYHVEHTPKRRKLDRLKSESRSVTNETPTCVVPLHAPQTNALCWAWGVREVSSAGEVGCWRRLQLRLLCMLAKGVGVRDVVWSECYLYQKIEESWIQVCALLQYLQKKMLLIQNRVWPQYPLKVGTAQQHYFCKFWESAQTSRFDFLLHFDMRNIFQICTEKWIARRLPSTAMLERWPQVCRVTITFELPLINRSISWIPLRNTQVQKDSNIFNAGHFSGKAHCGHECENAETERGNVKSEDEDPKLGTKYHSREHSRSRGSAVCLLKLLMWK